MWMLSQKIVLNVLETHSDLFLLMIVIEEKNIQKLSGKSHTFTKTISKFENTFSDGYLCE